MVNIYSFSEKVSRSFTSNKSLSIVISLFLGIALLYLVKSCTFNTLSEPVYHIGQDSRWSNLNLMGKERNLTAFNNELLSTFAKREHFRLYLTVTSDPVTELEQGKLEGILTFLQPSYLNENRLLFSDPYFPVGPVLIIPATAPLDGWNDKRRKIIGIQANSHSLLSLEQDPTMQVKIYDDILHALSDLSARRIDGAIFPAIPAYTYTMTFYKNELKIVTLPLTDEAIRLVALNNETGKSLIQHFNHGLATLKQEGTYDKMLERWGFINVEEMKP